MTDDHRRLRESLGAYVLGVLEPAERRELEVHIAGCTPCTEEAARFGPIPGLLGRVDVEEAAASQLIPSPGLLDGVASALDLERANLRSQVVRWRTVAATAVAAGTVAVLVLAAPWQAGPDRLMASAAPVAAEASSTTGEAATIAWEWGTTVELRVESLPPRSGYVLVAIGEDGQREQAGTWGATRSRSATVRGASSIQRDDLDRVEITDSVGTVLVAFPFR